MKKIIGIICTITISFGLNAQVRFNGQEDQPKTLLGNKRLTGGYVGMGVQGFDINGQYGYGFSGEAAMSFGRKFNLGFAGQALATDVFSDYKDPNGDQYFYEMAYGGLYVEPMFKSKWAVHVTFPITLGAGAVSESKYRIYDGFWDEYRTSYDVFFVAQAGLNVELNVFKFMRIAGGISYRQTSDVILHNEKDNLSGLGGNITLKLGWF